MNRLSKAIEIAAKAHAGQIDKSGLPYIYHPLQVMLNLKNKCDEIYQIVAVLHDVIEDTDVTLKDLEKHFSPEVIDAIDAITKRKGEKYHNYLSRICTNKVAAVVKVDVYIQETNIILL